MKTIYDELTEWGIYNPEHLGDGAYVGVTGEGIALFTSDGITMTRPVCLDANGIRALDRYLNRQ